MEWEVGIIEWIQGALGSLNETVGKVLSFIGGETGLMLVVLIVLFCWRKETGKRLALIVAAVNTWLPMLKAAVLRLRPYMEYPDRVKGVADVGGSADLENVAAQGYSFPSMHSANAVGMFSGFAMFVRKNWARMMAIIIPLLVGFSRVVVGVHYPTDVLAGWVLGLVAVFILDMLTKHVPKLWVRYAVVLLTAVPGLFYCKSTDYFTGLGLMIGFFSSVLYEKRYVNFEKPRNAMWFILRIVCGFALFILLSSLLKLPFSKEFLDGGSMASLYVRTLRYAVTSFIVFGIYPLVFKAEKKA
jgi:membrane-associated phospholipid phosphatase